MELRVGSPCAPCHRHQPEDLDAVDLVLLAVEAVLESALLEAAVLDAVLDESALLIGKNRLTVVVRLLLPTLMPVVRMTADTMDARQLPLVSPLLTTIPLTPLCLLLNAFPLAPLTTPTTRQLHLAVIGARAILLILSVQVVLLNVVITLFPLNNFALLLPEVALALAEPVPVNLVKLVFLPTRPTKLIVAVLLVIKTRRMPTRGRQVLQQVLILLLAKAALVSIVVLTSPPKHRILRHLLPPVKFDRDKTQPNALLLLHRRTAANSLVLALVLNLPPLTVLPNMLTKTRCRKMALLTEVPTVLHSLLPAILFVGAAVIALLAV